MGCDIPKTSLTQRYLLGRTEEQHEHLIALEEEEVLGFVGHGTTETPSRLLERGGVGRGTSVGTKGGGEK